MSMSASEFLKWCEVFGVQINGGGGGGPFLPLAGGTMTGNLFLNGAPLSANQAANKFYVDTVAAGLVPAGDCDAASTVNLAATYNNGTSGIGATLTLNATGVLLLDGINPTVGLDYLIKDQTAPAQNGIYTCTTQGAVGVAAVFTRSTSYDIPAQINSTGIVPIIHGSTQGGQGWYQINNITTIGTDPIQFVKFGNQGTVTSITAGTGLLGGTVTNVGTFSLNQAPIQQNQFNFGTDTGTSTAYAVTLNPVVASLTDGLAISLSLANTNTTMTPTLTVNANSPANIVLPGGKLLAIGDMPTAENAELIYNANIPAFVLQNPVSSLNAAYNAMNGLNNGVADTGSGANTYVGANLFYPTLAPVANAVVYLTPAHTNTGASTFAYNGSSALPITTIAGVALSSGMIIAGGVAQLYYTGTSYLLLNPNPASTYTYSFPFSGTDTGIRNAPIATLPTVTTPFTGLFYLAKVLFANNVSTTNTMQINSTTPTGITYANGANLLAGDIGGGYDQLFYYESGGSGATRLLIPGFVYNLPAIIANEQFNLLSTDTGTANSYIGNLLVTSGSTSGLGFKIVFIPANTNAAGASTIAFTCFGSGSAITYSIKNQDGTDPLAGQIKAGNIHILQKPSGAGTVMYLMNPAFASINMGGTGVTTVTTAPAATAWAGWDANKNLSANSFIQGYATTATAAGTTTLTVASAYQQYFTGSTTQTVLLPVTSTLVLGQSFAIVNNSTGVVTVQSSGGNTLQAMAANSSLVATCILTSGTTAASWSFTYTVGTGSFATIAGVQGNLYNYVATDTGTSGTNYVIALSPAPAAYVDGAIYSFRPAHTNTVGNPTFAIGALAAKTIVIPGGGTLSIADIQGQSPFSYVINVQYNALTDNFALLNPCISLASPVLVSQGQLTNVTDTGTTNAYAGTSLLTPNASHVVGQFVFISPANTNTGASTFNYNGLGAVAIKTSNGAALSAGMLVANSMFILSYDGSAYRLINPAPISTPTASTFAAWDTNSNLSANNFVAGYTTTATAAGTTTLTVGSTYQQYFTGTTTQTCQLPVASTLVLGQAFQIINNSTGVVTVQSSGANTLQAMAGNTMLIATCILTSGTTAASWSFSYQPLIASGGSVTVPHFNFIYGGNFDINPFQRYQFQTNIPAGGQNKWFADRFSIEKSASTWSGGQFADAPSQAQCGLIVSNCLQVTKPTAFTVGSTDFAQLVYCVEGLDFRYLAQSPMTLSFWVKATVNGTYNIAFINNGQDQGYVAPYTINSANTWEFKTITVTSTATGSWNYGNGAVGLRINFVMACGSGKFVTANSWVNPGSNAVASTGQANAFASNGNVFQLALVQLEEGSAFSEFQKRSTEEEIAFCQRYYENCFPVYSYTPRLTGDNASYASVGNSTVLAGIQYADIIFNVAKTGNANNLVWSKVNNTSGSVSEISSGSDLTATANGFSGARLGIHFTNAAGQYGGQFYWESNAEIV